MSRLLRILFLLLCHIPAVFFADSQDLQVLDFLSGKPVEGVALFNQDRTTSVISNVQGFVSLSAFKKTDSIYFQHPSYQMVVFTREGLETLEFKVYLYREVRMLEEFVISVSKWEQNRREIPNKIQMLSATEIQFNNPQTSADLVGISNEVFIQKSQLGGGSPMIRGFSANAVLLVVDGVRMNNAIYRSGNLQNVISLDPNTIERSEVIFGPGSVVYGSDALGGVMDFHTRGATLSTGDKPRLTANIFGRYSSANKEKTSHLDFNFGGKKWALLSSISYSDFDDLRMGSRKNPGYRRTEYVIHENGMDTIIPNKDPDVQKFSGYSQINILEKLRYRPGENLNLTYAFHYSKLSDVPRYDRLIEYSGGLLKFATWDYGPQQWMMHSLNARYDKANSLFSNGRITIAYQDYKESRLDRKFGKSGLNKRLEQVDIFSVNLDFDKKLKKENYLFYGFESNYNDVTSTGIEENIYTGTTIPIGTRYPDGMNKYSSLAVYISYKNNLSDLLTLNTGIRYNRVTLHSTIEDTSFYHFPYDVIDLATSAVNGSAGLVIRPNDYWQINLNAASGYRAPNLDDVGKIFDSEPGNVVVPNKDLDPEYTYNIDLGTVVDFSSRGRFEVTGFITFVRDIMVRREFLFNNQDSILYDGTMSKVFALVNADKALIYGGNITFGINLSRFLEVTNTLNVMYGEDQDGIPLRHISPVFGSTHFMIHLFKLNLDLFANYNCEKPNKHLAPSEQSKTHMYALDEEGNPYAPGWFTLNLKGAYQVNRYLLLQTGVENILDHRYRPYSSGIVAPGRNFYFTLRLSI